MDQDEIIGIQKIGAIDRAQGKSQFENPYFSSDVMPAATGEAVADWARKADAWHLGWTVESAMQPS